jgi:predicted dehydrogenase
MTYMKFIGIVGAEILDTYYFRAGTKPDCRQLRVYSACDATTSHRHAFPEMQVVSDICEIMDDPAINVVYISDAHLLYASAFLAAGKSVIVI